MSNICTHNNKKYDCDGFYFCDDCGIVLKIEYLMLDYMPAVTRIEYRAKKLKIINRFLKKYDLKYEGIIKKVFDDILNLNLKGDIKSIPYQNIILYIMGKKPLVRMPIGAFSIINFLEKSYSEDGIEKKSFFNAVKK